MGDSEKRGGFRGMTYVDQPSDVSLDGSAAEEEVDLVVVVAWWGGSVHAFHSYKCHLDGKGKGMKGDNGCSETRTISPQILNTPQRRLPIRHRRIQIMLLPMMIHAEALKRQVPPRPKMRLHGPRQEQRALHPQRLHPLLHHRQLQRDDACNLNRAAEGDLPVALAEMQVPDAEFRALDVDGQVHFAAAREVLDVAVAAVLGAAGHGAGAFAADLVFDLLGGAAGVDVLRLGGEGDLPAGVVAEGGDELGFAAVPFCEDGGGGGASEDAWVDVAWESDVRYMT